MSTTSIIPRKRIVFCHGDKGGVGKSTFARIMADWYTQNNIPFKGFDTDSTNGQFLRFYGDKITPLALRDPSNLDQILNTLESAHDVTLVDLGARSGDILNE